MSPRAAIHSPIFQTYLLITLGVLVGAGAVLFVAQRFLRRDLSSVWPTYVGWLIMVPAVIAAVLLGRVAVIAGTMLLSAFAFKEFARATGLYRDWWMTGTVYALFAALAVIAIVPDPYLDVPGWFGMYMAMPVYGIGAILLIPILRNRAQGQLQAAGLSVFGFLYLGWMFGHLMFFANSGNSYGYLLFVILAAELNDVAAFTFGRLFGRHRLRSNISPKKTWEGAVGALLVSMAMPWLLGFSFPHFGPLQKILAGLIVGVGGQLGDLTISFIKRDLGIKDMGATIPGHGGILDRIDSLIFAAPLFLHMVRFFYGL